LQKSADECGGLVQLWGEAAKWSFGERVLPTWLKQLQRWLVEHRNPRDAFKEWWQRAVFAMGHSNWLEGELNEMIFKSGPPNLKFPDKSLSRFHAREVLLEALLFLIVDWSQILC
jgi:hypothetical protein